MPDISIRLYNKDDKLSALNAPHKFRSWQILRANTKPCLRIWNLNKENEVLTVLMYRIQNLFALNETFAFAMAPSNVTIFVDDIKMKIQQSFPNALDLSGCFSKINNCVLIKERRVLTEDELRQRFRIDKDYFTQGLTENITQLLLVDDVYGFGNTFNGMKLLVRDIKPELKIKTAVILTTT